MAHLLNTKNGKTSFFYTAAELPWHGLGKKLEKAATSKEAIEAAQLDYEVNAGFNFVATEGSNLPPMYIPESVLTQELKEKWADRRSNSARDGVHYYAVPCALPLDKRFTYRMDTGDTFGSVSDRYQVFQNYEAFDFMDALVGEGEAMYETAGCLGKGETVFITAKLPAFMKVGKDQVDKYFVVTLSHDGTSAVTIFFTPIRIVCNNTLRLALSMATNKMSFRHSSSIKDRMSKGAEALGIGNSYFDLVEESLNKLVEIPCSEEQFANMLGITLLKKDEIRNLIDGITPETAISARKYNIIADMKLYYQKGVGQDVYGGTMYAAYNALTGYHQNAKNYSSLDTKFKNTFDGNFYKNVIEKAQPYMFKPERIDAQLELIAAN